MRTRSRDGVVMRNVLAAMITDRAVCMKVAGKWPANGAGLFDAPWANLVGGWCVNYARKYGEPPKGQLRTIYEEWAAATKSPDETVQAVERFLEFTDEEHKNTKGEHLNSDYLLDQADRYFNGVKLKEAITQAEELLDLGRVAQAKQTMAEFKGVNLSTSAVVNVGEDWEAWRRAWDDDRNRPLLNYPGSLQGFLGRWMQRDTLIGFMAPDKTGKSVFLMDLAVRAMLNRCRVVYFDVGDNSEGQVLRRLGSRVARHPLKENFFKEIDIPVSVNKEGEVETAVKKFAAPLTVSKAFKEVQKATRGVRRFRLSCHANGTASADDISNILASWSEEECWAPDVVVIDYADILAPPAGAKDSLDQIDETWKRLRRISQQFHCLVVTATQSSAAAYQDKATVLKKQHFSGRKTKLAHVNGMIGINVSNSDRQNGITRLNWIVRREGGYTENEQKIVAGCWNWYNPVVQVAE